MNLKSLLLDNKSVKQTIFKNTFWLMLSEGISGGLMFLLTILIARYLGAEEYGIFSFAFAFVALFTVIADFGLSTLTIREVARDKSLARKYIDNIAVIKLILGIITFGLIILTIQFLGKTPEVKTLVYLVAIWTIIQSFTAFFQSIFRAFEEMQYEALTKIIYSCLLFAIAFFAIWQNLEIKAIIQSYIYASLIAFIFTLILVRKNFTKFWGEIDFGFWEKLLKKSIPIGLGLFFVAIYVSIDIAMLQIMGIDYSQIGLYNAAYKILAIPIFILGIIATSFFPILSKKTGNLKNIIKNYFKVIFAVTIPAIFAIEFFSKEILDTIYGQNFILANNLLKILTISLLFIALREPYIYIIIARNKQKIYSLIAFLGAIFNILTNLFFIKYYGAIGAAITTTLTEMLIFLSIYTYIKKINPRIIAQNETS